MLEENKALSGFKNAAILKQQAMEADAEVIQLSREQARSKAEQLLVDVRDYKDKDQEQTQTIAELKPKLTRAELSLQKTENELASLKGYTEKLKDFYEQQKSAVNNLKTTVAHQE